MRRNFKSIKISIQSSLKLIISINILLKKKSQRKYLQLLKIKHKMIRNSRIFKTNSMIHSRKEPIEVKKQRLLKLMKILNLVQLNLHQQKKMRINLTKKKRKPKLLSKSSFLLQPPKIPFLTKLLRLKMMILNSRIFKTNSIIHMRKESIEVKKTKARKADEISESSPAKNQLVEKKLEKPNKK